MRILWSSILCALALAPPAAAQGLAITGATLYKPHTLVRLTAEGADAKAALLWRVHPARDVQRAASPRGLLEFAAPPGTYEVELLAIRQASDGLQVDEVRTVIEIEACAPPGPEPPPPADGTLDPVNALGRIRFGNAGCTATVIGPRRPDGRWDVLTAAHCTTGVGQRGTLMLPDGRTLAVRVAAHHKTPDLAWCVTDEAVEHLPYARVAPANPAVGTAVWHQGFGVDRPGNREEGRVAQAENDQGQLRMILSVSSGDSGGGIFRADTNELVSVVCCTSGMARKVSMWGAAAEVIARHRPRAADSREPWTPLPIPIRAGPEDDGRPEPAIDEDWRPLPMPIVRHPRE